MLFEIICIRHIRAIQSLQKLEVMRIRHFQTNKTFIAQIMSYSREIETFERNWITRNNGMSYTYDFETHKSFSHKQIVLYYGPVYRTVV